MEIEDNKKDKNKIESTKNGALQNIIASVIYTSNPTPKEKAWELLHKYFAKFQYHAEKSKTFKEGTNVEELAKDCADMEIKEILNVLNSIASNKYEYWEQVNVELHLL